MRRDLRGAAMPLGKSWLGDKRCAKVLCAVLKCSELYILLVDLFMLSVSTNKITTGGTTNRTTNVSFCFSEDDNCYGVGLRVGRKYA